MTAPHPAPFSDPVMRRMRRIAAHESKRQRKKLRILDPFAGVGKIHELRRDGHSTVGVELEPEWAEAHSGTVVADATVLPFANDIFDAVMVSPCYGNRMSDHHNARDKSHRRTYKHYLGRNLSPNNAGQMQWGPAYCQLHSQAWGEVARVLRPGGLMVLNISNHIRNGKEIAVVEWHVESFLKLGWYLAEARRIPTRRYGFGANRELRVDGELLISFRVPGGLRHGS